MNTVTNNINAGFQSQQNIEQLSESVKTLCAALSRMLKMHDLVMDKTNIHASFYDAECIFEMNKAPMQARQALAQANCDQSDQNGLDEDVKKLIDLLEAGTLTEDSAKTPLAARLAAQIAKAINNRAAQAVESGKAGTEKVNDFMEEAEVMERIGRRSKSALWSLRKKGGFPEPVLLYPSRYSRKAVEAWIAKGGVNAAD